MTRATKPWIRPPGPGRPDDVAVSNVIGAIMVFGLMVMTLVTIEVRFVPVWDREKEAGLMQQVSNQFGIAKSDMDRLADNRSFVPVTTPVTLGVEGGFDFFSNPTVPAALAYTTSPAGTGFSASSPQLRILERNGQPVFAGAEDWIQIVSGTSVTDVGGIAHLRLRIASPESYSTGHSTTFNVLDSSNAFHGAIRVTNIDHGSTYTYEFRTFAASSQTTPVSIIQENFDKKNPPAYLYFDLLRDTYQFNDVLAQAPRPFVVNLERNGMQSEYTMAYDVVAPDGGVTQVGGGGVVVPNFQSALPGGSVTLASRNQQFVRQTYVLEYGAVIVAQPDGSVMRAAPQFTSRLTAGQLRLDWVVPSLAGSSSSLSGPTQAGITVAPGAQGLDLVATGAQLTFTLATNYGAVWAQYFTTELQRAGLTSAGAQPQFTVSSTATSVTLQVFGVQSSPSSTVDDIFVKVRAKALPTFVHAGGSR